MYRGECLGLRAYLHFDLLRMFGSVDPDKRGIPYVTKFGMFVTPFSHTKECYQKIIADLKSAESLLKDDENLLTYPRQDENSYSSFTSFRTTHFNLYAVKAFLARVYWTRNDPGDLDSAAMYAREVIESGKFPLPSKETGNINTDHFMRMMSGTIAEDEAIFGIYMEDSFTEWQRKLLVKNGAYLPADINLYKDAERGNDLRDQWIRIPIFNSSQEGEGFGLSWMKLIDAYKININNKQQAGIGASGMNLIRIPEMYLILSEALLDKNVGEARKFFDEFLVSRQAYPLADEEVLTIDKIDTEFKKR